MAPYPSKMLVRSVRGVDPAELSEAIEAIADLEWWTRGGSDYASDGRDDARRQAAAAAAVERWPELGSRAMRAARLFLRAPVLACSAPLLDGLVDPRDQRSMLALDRLGVAGLDGTLEPPEVRS